MTIHEPATLLTDYLLGLTMGAALACELATPGKHLIWRRILNTKFLIASVAVVILPDFLVAIADYGVAMIS